MAWITMTGISFRTRYEFGCTYGTQVAYAGTNHGLKPMVSVSVVPMALAEGNRCFSGKDQYYPLTLLSTNAVGMADTVTPGFSLVI